MTKSRQDMERAIKELTTPFLRDRGYRGSFPNFYREAEGFVSLINFQFFSSGGSFCVNISYADPDRSNVYIQKETVPSKLRVSQTTDRMRLQCNPDPPGAVDPSWFVFGKTSYKTVRGQLLKPADAALLVNELVLQQSEDWLRGKQAT